MVAGLLGRIFFGLVSRLEVFEAFLPLCCRFPRFPRLEVSSGFSLYSLGRFWPGDGQLQEGRIAAGREVGSEGSNVTWYVTYLGLGMGTAAEGFFYRL